MKRRRPDPGSEDSEPLVDPALRRTLERAVLHAPTRLTSGIGGSHRAARFGASLDVADHRPYQPGDDLRHLDLAAFARLGTPWVRLFDAEESLRLRLVIDTSGSMGATGASGRSCWFRAAQMAALLAVMALGQRDPVVLDTFDAAVRPLGLRGGSGEQAVVGWLAGLRPGGKLSPMAARRVIGDRADTGLTVVLSDLLDASWPDVLATGCGRGLVMVRVRARDEVDPAWEGPVILVDREADREVALDLDDRARRDHLRRLADHDSRVATAVRSAGGAVVDISTDDDLVEVFMRQWRRAGLVR